MLISRNDFDHAAVNVIRNNRLPCNYAVADGCSGTDDIVRIKGERAAWLVENHPEEVVYETSDVYVHFDAYYDLACENTCAHEFCEERLEYDPACVDDYIYWQWFVFMYPVDFAVLCEDAWIAFGLTPYKRQILSCLEGTEVAAKREIGFAELNRIVNTLDGISDRESMYISHLPFEKRCELAATASCYEHNKVIRAQLSEMLEEALKQTIDELDEDEVESVAETERDWLLFINEQFD